MRPMQYR